VEQEQAVRRFQDAFAALVLPTQGQTFAPSNESSLTTLCSMPVLRFWFEGDHQPPRRGGGQSSDLFRAGVPQNLPSAKLAVMGAAVAAAFPRVAGGQGCDMFRHRQRLVPLINRWHRASWLHRSHGVYCLGSRNGARGRIGNGRSSFHLSGQASALLPGRCELAHHLDAQSLEVALQCHFLELVAEHSAAAFLQHTGISQFGQRVVRHLPEHFQGASLPPPPYIKFLSFAGLNDGIPDGIQRWPETLQSWACLGHPGHQRASDALP
jgi:hypothetical protein